MLCPKLISLINLNKHFDLQVLSTEGQIIFDIFLWVITVQPNPRRALLMKVLVLI